MKQSVVIIVSFMNGIMTDVKIWGRGVGVI